MRIKEKQRTPNAFFDCAALLTLCSGKEKSVFRVGTVGAGLESGLFLTRHFSTSRRSYFLLLFITKEERKSINCQ